MAGKKNGDNQKLGQSSAIARCPLGIGEDDDKPWTITCTTFEEVAQRAKERGEPMDVG